MKISGLRIIGTAFAALALQSCSGIFSSIYDEPEDPAQKSVAGELYIDASDWKKWYYIDLPHLVAVSDEEDFSPNSLWESFDIPMKRDEDSDSGAGIYTYWYDVLGSGGLDVNEFRSFMPTKVQPEPEAWTIALHRNNVRTNNCMVAKTQYESMEELPADRSYLAGLTFMPDEWSERDVWCVQDKMLLGLIGNEGIKINNVLSSWLEVSIPPIPPSFKICRNVFIIKLPDDTYGALRLENYQSPLGVKCCLTINYRYPI